jgi:hypothetical protein
MKLNRSGCLSHQPPDFQNVISHYQPIVVTLWSVVIFENT